MLAKCLIVVSIFHMITSSQQILDLSNWMQVKSSVLWNMSLSDMTILGTHDAGAYNLTKVQIPGYEPEFLEIMIYVGEQLGIPIEQVITMWGKAQPSNLYDQMMNGVRYIDLRCGWLSEPREWVTFHWEAGHTIQILMNDIAKFLTQHTQEIVLIEASHLDGIDIDDNKLTQLVNIFEKTFGNNTDIGLWIRNNSNPYYFPTYGEMITKGYKVFLSLSNDAFAKKYDNIQYGEIFQNTYADSDNVTYMMEFNDKQVRRFNNNQTNAKALFKISWTLTPNGDTILNTLTPGKPHNLLELADIADAKMWNWTFSKFQQNLRIGNVFIFDDYPKAATAQIIDALY
eukprot:88181_1